MVYAITDADTTKLKGISLGEPPPLPPSFTHYIRRVRSVHVSVYTGFIDPELFPCLANRNQLMFNISSLVP